MIYVGETERVQRWKTTYDSVFTTLQEVPEDTEEKSVIVVDSDSVSLDQYIEWSIERPIYQLYYVTGQHNSAQRMSGFAYGIQILTYHEYEIKRDKELGNTRPLIAFWGALPQTGVTTIAAAVAGQLAQERDSTVGFLGLNLYDPGSWLLRQEDSTAKTNFLSINDIRTHLTQKSLTSEILQQNMVPLLAQKLHYLVGNPIQLRALKYTPDEIEHLIEVAQDTFDIVVIDAGSMLNTAACTTALKRATHIFGVLDDRPYSIERYKQQTRFLQRIDVSTENIALVGNRMTYPKLLPQLAKNVGSPPLTSLKEETIASSDIIRDNDPFIKITDTKVFQGLAQDIVNSFLTSTNYIRG